MESTSLTPSGPPAEAVVSSPGELIVHNGRRSGKRRPLKAPLTVIGRAAGCDVRLNVDGINAQHCLLVATGTGLELRDLGSDGGTLVNGERVTTRTLVDEDVLSVGPFQFRVRLHVSTVQPANPGQTETPESLRREKEALRIQAAAVAAQQAALGEEEIKLRQRQTALQQQEEQLAAHLEEKRRRLVELRDQARSAHQTLRHDRAVYEERVARVTREVSAARREAQETQQRAEKERRRLIGLRRYLKQRWHRHWMAERRTMRRREDEIATGRRQLEREAERLRQEKAAQVQARPRCNGAVGTG